MAEALKYVKEVVEGSGWDTLYLMVKALGYVIQSILWLRPQTMLKK